MPGVALVVSALATATGCGYSTRRLVGDGERSSIAIVHFDNRTYRRDLEFRVTRAVAEEIRARASWRIESAATSDLLLKGTLRSADTTVLAETRDRKPIIGRYRISADIELIERATGRVLRRYTASERQEFTPERFNESLEGSTTDVIATSLAEDVVQGLERPIGGADTVPPPSAPRRDLPRR